MISIHYKFVIMELYEFSENSSTKSAILMMTLDEIYTKFNTKKRGRFPRFFYALPVTLNVRIQSCICLFYLCFSD